MLERGIEIGVSLRVVTIPVDQPRYAGLSSRSGRLVPDLNSTIIRVSHPMGIIPNQYKCKMAPSCEAAGWLEKTRHFSYSTAGIIS